VLSHSVYTAAVQLAFAGAAVDKLNHFSSMVLFALFISIGLAALGQRSGVERFRYAAWSFALFILVAIAIGWMMYPLSH
jgi:hypothetical protein